MVKYKNISGCHVLAIVDGKLIVVEPNSIASGRTVLEHPGLEKIAPPPPVKKIDKKRTNNASQTTTKRLRE